MSGQNEWLSKAEEIADKVGNFWPSQGLPRLINCQFIESTGDQAVETRVASFGQVLPHIHLFRGRYTHVGAMVRAKGVHGHFLGVRVVLGNNVCFH